EACFRRSAGCLSSINRLAPGCRAGGRRGGGRGPLAGRNGLDRAAMLTSTDPACKGIIYRQRRLAFSTLQRNHAALAPEELPTFPQIIKTGGKQTSGAGKF